MARITLKRPDVPSAWGYRAKVWLQLGPGECYRPGTPKSWRAPNGLEVMANPSGWNGSFHEAQHVAGWAWAGVRHRHIGPARRALRAFAAAFVSNPMTSRQALRGLVRRGD